MLFQGHSLTMFLISVVILFLCCFSGRIHCVDTVETVTVAGNVNESCSPWETDCPTGCCPFQDGVCCSDGIWCCPHGKICLIPYTGLCYGAVNNHGKISLTSEKSTRVRSSLLRCSSGTTECAPDKCCPLPNAVCCPDGEHCCPHGFTCNPSGLCSRDSANEVDRDFYSLASFDKPLAKMTEKPPYKSCPGGSRICPSYMSCCINDNGEWGCCPNPSLPEVRYGAGGCCTTVFGHLCCPDAFPHCTLFGCFI